MKVDQSTSNEWLATTFFQTTNAEIHVPRIRDLLRYRTSQNCPIDIMSLLMRPLAERYLYYPSTESWGEMTI